MRCEPNEHITSESKALATHRRGDVAIERLEGPHLPLEIVRALLKPPPVLAGHLPAGARRHHRAASRRVWSRHAAHAAPPALQLRLGRDTAAPGVHARLCDGYAASAARNLWSDHRPCTHTRPDTASAPGGVRTDMRSLGRREWTVIALDPNTVPHKYQQSFRSLRRPASPWIYTPRPVDPGGPRVRSMHRGTLSDGRRSATARCNRGVSGLLMPWNSRHFGRARGPLARVPPWTPGCRAGRLGPRNRAHSRGNRTRDVSD